MRYIVKTVSDHELPEGVTLVIVEPPSGPHILLLAGEHARGWQFIRAFEDSLESCALPSLLYAV